MLVQAAQSATGPLYQHATCVAMGSPKAATEMAERVRLRVNGLAIHPLIGREGRYLGTRELVVEKGRYGVIYRVRSQAVQVITMHDTRQQWPTDWREA